MVEYQKIVGSAKPITITGSRCDRCGFTLLDDDEEIWSAV
jgi:hypothetical protein